MDMEHFAAVADHGTAFDTASTPAWRRDRGAASLLDVHAPSAEPPQPAVVLHFELSQNEEHARLVVRAGTGVVDLGERVHHYALATLARQRLSDARRGLDRHSQGWLATDGLARMLGIDVAYVNIQMYRARRQLRRALPAGPQWPPLVERRRGELRIGAYAFSVKRGAVLEGGLRHQAAKAAGSCHGVSWCKAHALPTVDPGP